ncbi:MAG: hypothetical protein ACNI27_00620 [Desulfovibrio sp.]
MDSSTQTTVPVSPWDVRAEEQELRALEAGLQHVENTMEGVFNQWLEEKQGSEEARSFLQVMPETLAKLEDLSTALFGELLDDIEQNLTHAINEILGQRRTVSTVREIRNGRLFINFQILNDGNEDEIEDVLTGQGGSVCNILSVGLRLVALSQLDSERHRPFLVLDEQDCWLRPQLIPGFMKLISKISHRLGIQVLVISHHPLDLFSGVADAIYALRPDKENGAVLDREK